MVHVVYLRDSINSAYRSDNLRRFTLQLPFSSAKQEFLVYARAAISMSVAPQILIVASTPVMEGLRFVRGTGRFLTRRHNYIKRDGAAYSLRNGISERLNY